jgi:hypothetical protein
MAALTLADIDNFSLITTNQPFQATVPIVAASMDRVMKQSLIWQSSSISWIANYDVTVTEDLTVADTTEAQAEFISAITDAFTAADAVADLAEYTSEITDAMTVAESTATHLNCQITVIDTVGIDDVPITEFTMNVSVTDGFSIADTHTYRPDTVLKIRANGVTYVFDAKEVRSAIRAYAVNRDISALQTITIIKAI